MCDHQSSIESPDESVLTTNHNNDVAPHGTTTTTTPGTNHNRHHTTKRVFALIATITRCSVALILPWTAPIITTWNTVGSCRLWSIEAVAAISDHHGSGGGDSSTNGSINNSSNSSNSTSVNLTDLSPVYKLLLSETPLEIAVSPTFSSRHDDDNAHTVQSVTFGFFAWNPDDTGCQWYNRNSRGDDDYDFHYLYQFYSDIHNDKNDVSDDDDHSTFTSTTNRFAMARAMASVTAVVMFFAILCIGVEAVWCHRCYCFVGGGGGMQWIFRIVLLGVATVTHGTSIAMFHWSNVCGESKTTTTSTTTTSILPPGALLTTCSLDRGSHVAWAALVMCIVTLIVTCTTPKPRPLLRDWMTQCAATTTKTTTGNMDDNDPFCSLLCCCCCRHYCRRRKLVRTSSGRGWQISLERPGDTIRFAEMEDGRRRMNAGNQSSSSNDGSSSEEEDDIFVDVDRDFVGDEISIVVVAADSNGLDPNNDDTVVSTRPGQPPGQQHYQPKAAAPPVVLFPIKEPTVRSTTRKRQTRTTTTLVDATTPTDDFSSSPRYKNGVVVDDELFFDTVPG